MAENITGIYAEFEYGKWTKKWNRNEIFFVRRGFHPTHQSYFFSIGYYIEERITKKRRNESEVYYTLDIYYNKEDAKIIHAYAPLDDDSNNYITLQLKLNDGYTYLTFKLRSMSELYRKLKEFGFVVKNWKKVQFEKEKWAEEFFKTTYGTNFIRDYIGNNLKKLNKEYQNTLMRVALETY